MERFRRSWMLFKASWAMVREDRSLLKYPVVSGIAVLVVLLLVGGPLALTGALDFDGDDITIVQIVALFVVYFLSYLAIIFCNSALVSVVMSRMDGRPAALSGWAFARANIGSILGYAAIAATVGVVLAVISSKFEGAGKAVSAIGGAAWGIATFLVVPVLVVEKVGPIDALKRSAGLLKRTWGEQLIGNAGIGLFTGLLIVATVLVGAGLIALAVVIDSAVLIGLAVVITAIAVGLVAALSAALDTIYRSAVYRYATNEPIQDYQAVDSIPAAFRVK